MGCETMVYESYDSYGSWNNGLRVVQLVNCTSLEGLSGSHTLRTKKICRVLRCASHQYVNIYAVHQLFDLWTNVSRPVLDIRVVQVVLSHSRVVSVRQYWTRMLKLFQSAVQFKYMNFMDSVDHTHSYKFSPDNSIVLFNCHFYSVCINTKEEKTDGCSKTKQ